MSFLEKAKEVIKGIEDSKTPLIYFVITFFSAVTIRNFLEVFSDNAFFSFDLFSHYYSFHICMALFFIILFYFATKEKIDKIAKVIFTSYLIIIIAPLFDLIISFGKGYNIGYLHPELHGSLLLRFFTFGGELIVKGITPGLKIQVALILIVSFIYFYIKTSRLLRSLFYVFLEYSLIFLSAMTPFLLKWISEISGLAYEYSNINVFYFYLGIIFLQGIFLAYVFNKEYFSSIIKDIRPFRVVHYYLMFAFGIILGVKTTGFILTWQSFFQILFISISILFAGLFSIITNNLEDYNIDKISNRKRPLVRRNINPEIYTKIAWGFLAISLIYSAIVSFPVFFMIVLFIGNYFLYSMKPIKFKRVPFLSKLILSLNPLIIILLAFIFIVGSIEEFPLILYPLFLIGFTALENFIDIKDYEGDKAEGIKTLPTIFGLENSKIIIGLFFLIFYPVFCLMVRANFLLIPSIILGSIQFFLITRKNYNYKPVFAIYLFSVITMMVYFIK